MKPVFSVKLMCWSTSLSLKLDSMSAFGNTPQCLMFTLYSTANYLFKCSQGIEMKFNVSNSSSLFQSQIVVAHKFACNC